MGKSKHRITADGRCQRQRKNEGSAWTCGRCSFRNEDGASCQVCEEPREASEGEEDESEEEELQDWYCSECSFKNTGLLPYCELCETARSSAAKEADEERPCPLCSFHNPSARTACAMCQAPLTPASAPASASGPSGAGSRERPPEPCGSPEEVAPALEAVEALEEEERRLLTSMGWNPDDDEGGLEEWEIDAAQESLIGRIQAEGDREGLRERATREFESWKAR
ncbi:unnamed protein product [Effrenium voratum]|nr:unnamed protein product [Effrenium voratum]